MEFFLFNNFCSNDILVNFFKIKSTDFITADEILIQYDVYRI